MHRKVHVRFGGGGHWMKTTRKMEGSSTKLGPYPTIRAAYNLVRKTQINLTISEI